MLHDVKFELPPVAQISLLALSKSMFPDIPININQAARDLKVPLMTENRNRKEILKKIQEIYTPNHDPELKIQVKGSKLAQELVQELASRAGAINMNDQRLSVPLWFKSLIVSCEDRGYSRTEISELTGISYNTLRHWKDHGGIEPKEKDHSEDHNLILEAWKKASPKQRKNLEKFCNYFGSRYDSYAIARSRIRQVLYELGLMSPRGPKREDHGTHVKNQLPPHSIWEGDGKEISITINGSIFKLCWYAFVDQNTTLIVGSNIQKTESSTAFLNALKDGKNNTDHYAMGILIDNRLEDQDLSRIHRFSAEHGITIIRTFPGNSKSNGYIENNFSIFERFVGPISIDGKNPEEIAKSIATALVEVFTQQRNHSKRDNKGGLSPAELAEGAKRPDEVAAMLEKLQKRLNQQTCSADFKWHLIEPAKKHFEEQSAETVQKFKKILYSFSNADIIAAQAAYLAQVAAKTEKTFRSEYFMAILRNIEQTRAKTAFSEAFRAGVELKAQLEYQSKVDVGFSVDETANIFAEIIQELDEQPSNSHALLVLDSLIIWLLRYGYRKDLPTLWTAIDKRCRNNRHITMNRWQTVVSYLYEKIGEILMIKPTPLN